MTIRSPVLQILLSPVTWGVDNVDKYSIQELMAPHNHASSCLMVFAAYISFSLNSYERKIKKYHVLTACILPFRSLYLIYGTYFLFETPPASSIHPLPYLTHNSFTPTETGFLSLPEPGIPTRTAP
jgi:hypothetical protein